MSTPRYVTHQTATEQARNPCPFCTEAISVDAHVCPFCIRNLRGSNKGDVVVADISARRGIGVLMFVVLAQMVLLLAIVTHQT